MLKYHNYKNIIIIVLIYLLYISNLKSQYFIGKHKNDLIIHMKNYFKGFNLNTNVTNNTFKYLKYENIITQETILFFLNNNDTCISVRWLSDYSNVNERISYLNKYYNKINDTIWYYIENKKKIFVKLKEEEWYFTINYIQAQ